MMITRLLIVTNASIFALQAVYNDALISLFALWPIGRYHVKDLHAVVGFEPWQLITYVPFPKIISGRRVVQSSQDGNGGNGARSLDRSMQRCQVGARSIVIRRIGGKNSPQVRLGEDEYLIQALAAQCADQTFGTTILPRRPRRDRSIADTHRPHPRREDVSIGAVVVAHQVGWRRGPGECLGDQPSQPLGCRMPRHLEP